MQRRLNSAALQKADYKTVEAEDGAIAMAFLQDGQNFDAILSILLCPMDELEVLKAMKTEGFSVPVIIEATKGSIDVVISAMRGRV